MPSPLLGELETQVRNATTVVEGATTLVLGIPNLLQQAREEAVALGATAEQLQPFDALGDNLEAKANALAAAVAAVTPPPP